MFSAALKISFILGTPKVTFIEATPAKWKVFRVIWVLGSPKDYAVIAPTASPGWIKHLVSLVTKLATFSVTS